GIVGIVAVTDQQELLLIEQFRPPVNASVIELPAGLVGDEEGHHDEALADAAGRELLEETGYRASELVRLVAGTASAGISSEVVTLFRARGLTCQSQDLGVGGEKLTLHKVPLAQASAWLTQRIAGGAQVDLKVYAALFFLSTGI